MELQISSTHDEYLVDMVMLVERMNDALLKGLNKRLATLKGGLLLWRISDQGITDPDYAPGLHKVTVYLCETVETLRPMTIMRASLDDIADTYSIELVEICSESFKARGTDKGLVLSSYLPMDPESEENITAYLITEMS